MIVNRSNLLRYLTPGIIVAMVLGFSFIIPATAKEDKTNECGYGYGYTGHTDNESAQGEAHESQQAENNDEPCGEVSGAQDETADTGDKTEQADTADETETAATTVTTDKADKPVTHTVSAAKSGGGDKGDSEHGKRGGGD